MADPDAIEYTPFTEHRVRSGDTLEKIAQKGGITWQELSFFNFGTAVPAEVNRSLHEFVGCTKRTKDGKNFVFSDDDVPGIIYVPKAPQPFTLDTGEASTSSSFFVDMSITREGASAFTGTSPKRPAELYYMASPADPVRRHTKANDEIASSGLGR